MSIEFGFSHHPKWESSGGGEAFLAPLFAAGGTALEFTLYPPDEDYAALLALAERFARAGWHCSLHAPYKDPWNPAGFAGPRRTELQVLFTPALEFAERISELGGFDVPLVIHGAHGKGPLEQLSEDTREFLAWVLERTRRVRPMLENLPPKPGYRRVGETPEQVADLVNAISHPRLGACWDFGHSVLQGQGMPPEAFLRTVRHVHVHDINPEGEDHFPLVFGRVPWREDLAALKAAGFGGLVILEINGYRASKLPGLQGLLAQSFAAMTEAIA